MQVHIHVGFHKTGTTAMQGLFSANLERFPAATRVYTRSSLEVATLRNALRRFNDTPSADQSQNVRDAATQLSLSEQRAGTKLLVLSSISVCGAIPGPDDPGTPYARTGAAMVLLREGFGPDHKVTFSASTRQAAGWVGSLFRHHLRNRGIRITEQEYQLGPIGRFRFDALIADLRKVEPDLFVFAMEDDVAHRLGVGVSLLRHLGIDEAGLDNWQVAGGRNIGISRQTVDFLSRPVLRNLPRPLRARLAKWHSRRQL
jgi:hypothetical protein